MIITISIRSAVVRVHKIEPADGVVSLIVQRHFTTSVDAWNAIDVIRTVVGAFDQEVGRDAERIEAVVLDDADNP